MAERTPIWIGVSGLLGLGATVVLTAVGTAQQPNWTSIPAFIGYFLVFLAALVLAFLFLSAIRQGTTNPPAGQQNPITINIGGDDTPRGKPAQGSSPTPVSTTESTTDEKIRLADLMNVDSPPHMIKGQTLEDREIVGPAVVHVNRSDFERCTWSGSPDETFIETDMDKVVGVIGIDLCVFRRCTFDQVAIIGNRTYIDQWREGFGLSSDPPDEGEDDP